MAEDINLVVKRPRNGLTPSSDSHDNMRRMLEIVAKASRPPGHYQVANVFV